LLGFLFGASSVGLVGYYFLMGDVKFASAQLQTKVDDLKQTAEDV